MGRSQYRAALAAQHLSAMERVKNTPCPPDQKFKPGTRVVIAKVLGHAMSHFYNDRPARVMYTYRHAYGGNRDASEDTYALYVDGVGEVAWYNEDQLTEISS